MSATTTPEAREILDRALKLPPAERESIAFELLESVDPPPNSDADWEYWKTEIKRRVEAVKNGTMKTYTLEEAMAKILRGPWGAR